MLRAILGKPSARVAATPSLSATGATMGTGGLAAPDSGARRDRSDGLVVLGVVAGVVVGVMARSSAGPPPRGGAVVGADIVGRALR